jgi:NADPH-dependent 2,4-dienoyl-CoA reductase/sulfur reductase-like enzyme/TusA-related sulfurtransferase/rhodanese-related sulfurtransferase
MLHAVQAIMRKKYDWRIADMSKTGKKVVIVGGVAGGASCAARLRRLDKDADIVLFERGEYVSYANCGLPYHVSGVISSRDSLLLLTPEEMSVKYDLDVRVSSEVVSIDRKGRTVTVRKRDTGETYTERYDVLVLATGSSPVRPPIPGINSDKIMTLWTVPDADRIRNAVSGSGARKAIVVGGGFIGLEMAENLAKAGLEVSIVEMLDQVMAPLDFEMAQLLHEHLERNGVRLYLGSGVSSFSEQRGRVSVALSDGKTLEADIVILSIGASPNGALARAAGLAVNARGGIVVDDMLRTSDPNIYAVGDVTEVEDFIDKSRTMIPLAGPANRQGRIAANNIAGQEERYGGSQGTAIARVFELAAANTGLNEKTLVKRGLERGRDFESVTIVQNSHAGYYPGAEAMTLKLLFSPDGSRLFGAQIVGRGGVDKRIDVLAAAIRLGGGIEALKSLELAYAPPYSSAKDPVNMLGFTAENLITGKVAFASWDAVEKAGDDAILLDVREEEELTVFSVPSPIMKNIPLGELRLRLGELDRSKKIITMCAIGVRAYNAARILMMNGFKDVRVYPGGVNFYRATHYRSFIAPASSPAFSDSGHEELDNVPTASIKLDSPLVKLNCAGLQCPGPIMKVFEEMKKLENGQALEITASDPGFARDAEAWSRRTGNTFVSSGKRGGEYVVVIKKGLAAKAPGPEPEAKAGGNGKTIIVFSGDLDRALASFIIANGAAAMGRPVTMFFTFWGLNLLRKSNKVKVEKSFIEKMFGMMMPRERAG